MIKINVNVGDKDTEKKIANLQKNRVTSAFLNYTKSYVNRV